MTTKTKPPPTEPPTKPGDVLQFTLESGHAVYVVASAVQAMRPVLAGEDTGEVKTVLLMVSHNISVREEPDAAAKQVAAALK